jgi:peptide/nickel transport system permease protein
MRPDYLARRLVLFVVVVWLAATINFVLPRLSGGNAIRSQLLQQAAQGGYAQTNIDAMVAEYDKEFGLDKPLWQQFLVYVQHVLSGDFGTSFGQYPASVNTLIANALPWSVAIQLPAIIVGWIVGNLLGALAAFKGGWFDRGAFVGSLFFSSIPPFALAIMLLFLVGVKMQILPVGGAYSFGLTPELSLAFFGDAITYFWLPFWSIVLVFIGGQAVGMRSMAIYELGSDYVNYNRGLGVKDGKTVRYIFRNAMLPQFTGLALAIAAMISGALITELVFSYPGLGTLLFTAIGQNDYPVISAITLLITLAVLIANFTVDILTGFIDPRIRAAQSGER